MANDSAAKAQDPAAVYNQMFHSFQAQSAANLDRFWKNQELILGAMENFSRNWFSRRHEATQSALGASHSAASCDSPAEAMGCWREWFEGSMQRVMADLEDARTEFARIAELHWGDAPEGKPNGEERETPARPGRGKGHVTRLAA
jgi:hypothetical protein